MRRSSHGHHNRGSAADPAAASATNDDDGQGGGGKRPSSSSSSRSAAAAVERTYASLVQQYLSVLCHDNAAFLAERMVAHCPGSARASYLLAMCHYRAGSPGRARSVLVGFGGGAGSAAGAAAEGDATVGGGGVDGEEDGNAEEDEDVPGAMAYLLARCCVDLRLFGEAEDVLLRECRERFLRENYYVGLGGAGGGHGGGGAGTELGGGGVGVWGEMDDWILTTSPCPVPNGAAGLNLLGTVCRRTNRRGRAAEYYRMSLKLDPMMWSSYEALCEMGAASSDEDDPTKVFGVVPAALQRPSSASGKAEGDDAPPLGAAAASPAFSLSATPLVADLEEPAGRGMGAGGGNTGARHRSFATPTTPDEVEDPSYAFLGRAEGGGGDGPGRGARGASVGSGLHATSLFHTGGRGHRGSAAASAAGEPSASLFDTPGLTPIRRRGERHPPQPRPASQPRGGAAPQGRQPHVPPSAAASSRAGGRRHPAPADDSARRVADSARITDSATARAVAGRRSAASALSSPPEAAVDRARRVAARLYYGPSPETTPPPSTGGDTGPPPGSSLKLSRARHRRRRRLGGLTSVAGAGGTPGGCADDDAAAGGGERDAASLSRLSFSSSSAAAAAASFSGGPGGGPRAGEDLSTPFGEKRALFRQSEGGSAAAFASSSATTSTPAMRGLSLGGPTPSGGGGGPMEFTAEVGRGGSQADAVADEIDRDGGTDEDGGVRQILELLCTLGAAQRMLCQYRCQDALQIFHRLPHSHFDTGWVQHQVGRAHFEMADYHSAQHALEAMHRAEPHRMKGLEVLSTALWHLKKEVELSHLAQTAVDYDRTAPESWCVVGNCFSLQKEHETALTFFRRSVRLDPTFTYSHTLSGHEYVANEDFDKAVACYRDALRSDDRHYNAWYGLGAIYYRQEKYDLAEYHFRRALAINPQSSVLHCHLGMALHANGKPYEALDALAGAFRLDPRNPQARYQRATIWMSVDRPAEALAELEKVRDAAPREASVHFAMGRVLKRLGRPERAMRCFLTALDLDPKDNNLIKAAMDRLDEPDVDEDVSAF